MALNTSKCNHLTPLRFKGLTWTTGVCTDSLFQFFSHFCSPYKRSRKTTQNEAQITRTIKLHVTTTNSPKQQDSVLYNTDLISSLVANNLHSKLSDCSIAGLIETLFSFLLYGIWYNTVKVWYAVIHHIIELCGNCFLIMLFRTNSNNFINDLREYVSSRIV